MGPALWSLSFPGRQVLTALACHWGPGPCHHWPFLGLFPDTRQAASPCGLRPAGPLAEDKDALKADADVRLWVFPLKNFVSEN